MKAGELFDADIDGNRRVIYLSLICEGKGVERADHCFRYGPPSHEVVRDANGKPITFNAKGRLDYCGISIIGPHRHKLQQPCSIA